MTGHSNGTDRTTGENSFELNQAPLSCGITIFDLLIRSLKIQFNNNVYLWWQWVKNQEWSQQQNGACPRNEDMEVYFYPCLEFTTTIEKHNIIKPQYIYQIHLSKNALSLWAENNQRI